MRDTALPTDRQDESTLYEIRIKGHLDDRWAEWFDGLSFSHEGDETTILRGPVVDQAGLHGLHGLLRKVRDLALPLVSVVRIDRKQPVVAETDADADGARSTKEVDA